MPLYPDTDDSEACPACAFWCGPNAPLMKFREDDDGRPVLRCPECEHIEPLEEEP